MRQILPRPWTILPLEHKYYGTVIVDANGNRICDIWARGETDEESEPSVREMVDINAEEEEDWKSWFDWSHYESRLSYETACAITDAVNGMFDEQD